MRFVISAGEKLVRETAIPIRSGDMDAMGQVNNTICFRHVELVRPDWLYRVDGPPDPQGCGQVIENALCRTDCPGRIDAKGGTTTVWTDFAAQKSAPMPAR